MVYRNIIVGIDLQTDAPQICYFDMASRKTGARPMKIGNLPVDLREVMSDEEHLAAEKNIKTLAGILREALATVGIRDIKREIVGLMFTVRDLSKPMVALLRSVFEELEIPKSRAFMQEYKESLYYYTMYQKQEIWKHNAACFEIHDGNKVCFYALGVNRKTAPLTVAVKAEEKGRIGDRPEEKGPAFAKILRDTLSKDIFSSVFVTGDQLSEEWALEAKKVLVKGGRPAFTEEFIFARGACYSAREKADEKRIRGIAFSGDMLVKDNIGMIMQVGEKTAYYPLISAGVHWYNAQHDCEFMLGDQKRVVFVVSSSREGGRRLCKMELPGLPDRPERTTRLRMHVEFESKSRCVATVEDMGFGEMFPASGKVWSELLEGVR